MKSLFLISVCALVAIVGAAFGGSEPPSTATPSSNETIEPFLTPSTPKTPTPTYETIVHIARPSPDAPTSAFRSTIAPTQLLPPTLDTTPGPVPASALSQDFGDDISLSRAAVDSSDNVVITGHFQSSVDIGGASSADSTPTSTSTPTPLSSSPTTPANNGTDWDMVEVLAPIDNLEINIAESFPPKVSLNVRSGLPNGCVEFSRYQVDPIIRTAVRLK